MVNVPPACIYQLVETCKPENLLIRNGINVRIPDGAKPEALDIKRVVSSCPKIQRLDVHSGWSYQAASNFEVFPDHFIHCRQ
jgi:hypothetical protein